MGTYTTYAQIGASAWYSRRRRGGPTPAPLDQGDSTPAELLRLQCPRCEQTFPYAGTCPSCEVTLVDRTEVFVVPKNAETAAPPVKGSPYALLTGLFAALLPAAYLVIRGFDHDAGWMGVNLLAGLSGVAVLAGAFHLGRVLLRRLRRRRRLARRLRADGRLAASAIDALPAEATEPVRIRGRLRLRVENDALVVSIEDGSGSARLPSHLTLRVADRATLADLDEIAEGREVEVIGVGRRVPTEGETYRTSGSVFAFEGESTVFVWV